MNKIKKIFSLLFIVTCVFSSCVVDPSFKEDSPERVKAVSPLRVIDKHFQSAELKGVISSYRVSFDEAMEDSSTFEELFAKLKDNLNAFIDDVDELGAVAEEAEKIEVEKKRLAEKFRNDTPKKKEKKEEPIKKAEEKKLAPRKAIRSKS